jgi:hypothetical protein
VIEARRRGREVEGTPLLREHLVKNRIEGSNPSVSATTQANTGLYGPFCFSTIKTTENADCGPVTLALTALSRSLAAREFMRYQDVKDIFGYRLPRPWLASNFLTVSHATV